MLKITTFKHTLNLVALFALSPSLQAIELGSPFQENMVLQRNMPINVWGWALPNEKVSVKLGEGQSVETITNESGKWSLKLPEVKAGGPYTFTAKSTTQTISFKDVLVGEVWLCSGQSNMFMGYSGIPEIKAMAAKTKNVRCLEVDHRVAFKPQQKTPGVWKNNGPSSAVAMSFAAHLQESLKVPVGIIHLSWGSSSIEGWMPIELTKKLPHYKKQMEAFELTNKSKVKEIMAKNWKHSRKEDIFLRTQPNILFNAMMHPYIPYSCKGMVWYQGESNTKSIESISLYSDSQSMWIKELRQKWGLEKFHLMSVMLPRFGKVLKTSPEVDSKHPEAHTWAWMRDAQLAILANPHCSVINTIDLGSLKNIHPKDKAPIGKRLSLIAQRDSLNKKIIAEGPVVTGTKTVNNTLVVSYTNDSGITTTDGKAPRCFWIRAKGGNWKPAISKIVANCVHLSHPAIKDPSDLRYAFSAFPDVNLVNDSKLPAVPFRNDSDSPKAKK